MPIAPQTQQPRGPGQAQNRVDFLRGLDRTVQTRRPGSPQPQRQMRPNQPMAPMASPGITTPSAHQLDGTTSGIPNIGRLFSESLQAPSPQLRSMIPVEQMQQSTNAPTPGVGMNTQGY